MSSKFLDLLHKQIHYEFNASHQYVAIAVWFDCADLPQLAKRFYQQASEERSHALMIVQYFLDRDITVEFSGIDGAISKFADAREPIALALSQEKVVTEQIIALAKTAREEGDYLGEQFMQWFLKEQVEEVASMTTLLTIADRAGGNLFDLENFVTREMNATVEDTAGSPPQAGGGI